MILGRLITRTGSSSLSLIRPTLITKIFVAGDVLCFFIQAGGAGMLVQADDDKGVKRGENIILAGLILQILIFLFFILVGCGLAEETRGSRDCESGTSRLEEIHLASLCSKCMHYPS